MAAPTCSDQEFIALWRELQSPTKVAERLRVNQRAVMFRRRSIENRLQIELPTSADQRSIATKITHAYDKVRSIADISGVVIVFSDAHYMPGEPSIGHQALIKLIKQLKPKLIVANGDILDGGTIHGHGPIGWETKPTLRQELDAVIDRMRDVQKAARGAILHRTIGNHDIRFDKRLASMVPEYRDIGGTTLKDHLPEWSSSWSLKVNDNTMIKHRIHGGIHSGYNNTLKGGISTVTGHTHLLSVSPWVDYTGRRYGVSTGMLADPLDMQFMYAEDNPRPWCQGFAVLTYDAEGLLLPPELCEVVEGTAYFRGGVVV
jgi:hypothetical protein